MKYCPKCSTNKDESEFYKNRAQKDGLGCHCKRCDNLSKKDAYRKDPTKLKEKVNRYRKTNKGKRTLRKASEKWRASAGGQAWLEKTRPLRNKRNLERYHLDPIHYNLKGKSARAGVPVGVLKQVVERDKVCQLCHIDQDLQFDHVFPASLGGQGSLENLQLLCGSCNRFKSNNLFLPGGGMLVTKQQSNSG